MFLQCTSCCQYDNVNSLELDHENSSQASGIFSYVHPISCDRPPEYERNNQTESLRNVTSRARLRLITKAIESAERRQPIMSYHQSTMSKLHAVLNSAIQRNL